MLALEIADIMEYQNISYLRSQISELSAPRLVQKRTRGLADVFRITRKGIVEAETIIDEIGQS